MNRSGSASIRALSTIVDSNYSGEFVCGASNLKTAAAKLSPADSPARANATMRGDDSNKCHPGEFGAAIFSWSPLKRNPGGTFSGPRTGAEVTHAERAQISPTILRGSERRVSECLTSCRRRAPTACPPHLQLGRSAFPVRNVSPHWPEKEADNETGQGPLDSTK